MCLHYPNVHKVVCARPGPTSKADCLNNIIDALLRFQQDAGIEFAGFILHDAEDVISPMELRLFNYLLPNKDMIQIPVYPYAPEWKGFTAGHYVDEFAENHGKDVIVREALTGQCPAPGSAPASAAAPSVRCSRTATASPSTCRASPKTTTSVFA